MIEFGKQIGKVAGMYLNTDDKVFVNVKLALQSGDFVYKRIYITEASKGIARAQLKACGMDLDKGNIELSDLDDDPNLLNGTEVPIDIYEDSYNGKPQLRVDIVLERPKADKSKLEAATALLRSAKKQDEPHPAEGKKVIEGFPKQPKSKPEKAPDPALSERGPKGDDIPF
ncbi:MAG TPA: hypothetical protein VEA41_17490 [Salinarimonas sp.]|nr:hypothetical protein [Salinarimonas sp.]